MGISYTVNSEARKQEFLLHVEELYNQHKYVTFSYTTGRQRSAAQNNALHMWLGRLAKELNDAGLDMRVVLKPEVHIPWTLYSAKDHLWRPVQRAICGKDSTVDPERGEYIQIYQTISRHLSQSNGFTAPEWPSND